MKLKFSFAILFFFCLLTVSSCIKEDKDRIKIVGHIEGTINSGGLQREYSLYFPENLPVNPPLVFLLHGYYGNSKDVMENKGMNKVADTYKFVVCYPQGTIDNHGNTHWNARLNISSTNDIAFLTELANYLQNQYGLDSLLTFSCGHSNGGFMSYTLACEAPNVFRAIASMAGTMSGYNWRNNNMVQPIPILQIHGLADQMVPIDGSMSSVGGWGGAPAVDSIVNFWVELNQCSTVDSSFLPDNTYAYYYSNDINNNKVWYYKIENWGHGWPGNDNASHTGTIASEVIWEFFSTIASIQ